MNTFGEEIRSARDLLVLKQKQVCKEVNSFLKKFTSANKKKGSPLELKQVTLSAWELGRQVPDVQWRSVMLEALAHVLRLNSERLTALVKEYEATSRLSGCYVMDEDKYLREIDSIVNKHNYEISLWFIGPHSLPILKSGGIRARWIFNIGQGVKYNVLWFVDQIESDKFNELLSVMHEIELRIEAECEERCNSGKKPGSINHYAIDLFPTGCSSKDGSTGGLHSKNDLDDIGTWEQSDDARVEYEKQMQREKAKWEQSDGARVEYEKQMQREKAKIDDGLSSYNKFFPIMRNIPDSLKKGIQLYWQSFGSLVLFRPEDFGKSPVVSLSLEDVRSSTDGDNLSLFVFLSLRHAFILRKLMDSVATGFSEERKEVAQSATERS